MHTDDLEKNVELKLIKNVCLILSELLEKVKLIENRINSLEDYNEKLENLLLLIK